MEPVESEHFDMNQAFVVANIAGALLVAFWMKMTTPRGSISLARHDKQAMWDMLRRLFYISVAGAFAGMALWVKWGWIDPVRAEIVFWCMIGLPMLTMMALRAVGIVNQDRWVGLHGLHQRPPRPLDDIAIELRGLAVMIQDPVRRDRALALAADLERASGVEERDRPDDAVTIVGRARWPG